MQRIVNNYVLWAPELTKHPAMCAYVKKKVNVYLFAAVAFEQVSQRGMGLNFD